MKDFLQFIIDSPSITLMFGLLFLIVGCSFCLLGSDAFFEDDKRHYYLRLCFRIVGNAISLAGVFVIQVAIFNMSLWVFVSVDIVIIIFGIAALINKWKMLKRTTNH